jgi:adenylylsulfate kinase
VDTPGFVVWLTGLPASGKSTLAQELRYRLAERGLHSVILDSDELRAVLTPNPTYSAEERDWFYAAMVDLAAWLARNGVNVLVADTAHRRAYRQRARAQIRRFAEAYVCCPPDACQARDRKGIYQRAASGQAEHVPGMGAPYAPPLAPEAVVDTGRQPSGQAADIVLAQLGPVLAPVDQFC